MVYFVHFRAIDALHDALRETIPIPKSRKKVIGFGEPEDDDGEKERKGKRKTRSRSSRSKRVPCQRVLRYLLTHDGTEDSRLH